MTEAADVQPSHLPANGKKKYGICAISGAEIPRKNLVSLETLRPSLTERILADFPQLTEHSLISRTELARYGTRYVEEILREEHGEYSDLDREVVESIARQDTIAANTDDEFDEKRSFGERVSDGLASFGGSWAFLISFGCVLVVWMLINIAEGPGAFDAYPFILLNLVLSCIAAIQAPIIMMSQKRQEQKDRARSSNDYQVNLKAELEIRHLHEKIDHLITKQWQRLAEIQQVQLEMMQETQRDQARKLAKAAAGKRKGPRKPKNSEPKASETGNGEPPEPGTASA